MGQALLGSEDTSVNKINNPWSQGAYILLGGVVHRQINNKKEVYVVFLKGKWVMEEEKKRAGWKGLTVGGSRQGVGVRGVQGAFLCCGHWEAPWRWHGSQDLKTRVGHGKTWEEKECSCKVSSKCSGQKETRSGVGARECSIYPAVPWSHGKNSGLFCKRNWESSGEFGSRRGWLDLTFILGGSPWWLNDLVKDKGQVTS